MYLHLITLFAFQLNVTIIAMGIGLPAQVSQPTLSIWSSLNFSLPFFTLSLSLNIILTLMIVLHLLIQRRCIVEALGSKYAQRYISMVAIVVESAAISPITSITFLGLYISNNSVQNVYFQILPQVEVSSLFFACIKYWGELVLFDSSLALYSSYIVLTKVHGLPKTSTLPRSVATPRFTPNNPSIVTHLDMMFDGPSGPISSHAFPGYPTRISAHVDTETPSSPV